MLSSALATGCAALIYTAVVAPLIGAYGRWKTDPARAIVHRRNIFGTFVPDLRRKRVEWTLWAVAAGVFVFGLAAGYTIMTNGPRGSYFDKSTNTFILKVNRLPQKGE